MPLQSLANYGIQSQGQGAVATVTGAVKLTGNGAIGVYVKDGGAVDVDGDGVRFMSGVKQTGFLIYGKGSAVSVRTPFRMSRRRIPRSTALTVARVTAPSAQP